MSNNNIHTYIHIYIHKYSLSRWAKAPSNFNKPPRLGQWIPTLKSESWLKGHISEQRVSGGHTFPDGLSIENVDIMRIHRIFTIFTIFTYSCVYWGSRWKNKEYTYHRDTWMIWVGHAWVCLRLTFPMWNSPNPERSPGSACAPGPVDRSLGKIGMSRGGILNRFSLWLYPIITGWWFQTCFIFHNIWDNPSHWLLLFKMVKTTNQFISCSNMSQWDLVGH